MSEDKWWFIHLTRIAKGDYEPCADSENVKDILSEHTARIVEVLEGMVAPLEGAANLQANISWNAALDEAITKIKEI